MKSKTNFWYGNSLTHPMFMSVFGTISKQRSLGGLQQSWGPPSSQYDLNHSASLGTDLTLIKHNSAIVSVPLKH